MPSKLCLMLAAQPPQLLHAMFSTRYTTSCACSSSHISHHMASISLPTLPPLVSALNLPVFSSPTTGPYVSIVSAHTTHSSNPNPITNCSQPLAPTPNNWEPIPREASHTSHWLPWVPSYTSRALKENCHMRLHWLGWALTWTTPLSQKQPMTHIGAINVKSWI